MRAAKRKAYPLAALFSILVIGIVSITSNSSAQLSAAPTEISGGAEAAMQIQKLAAQGVKVRPEYVGPVAGDAAGETWHGISLTFSRDRAGLLSPQTIFPGVGFDAYAFDDNISETGFLTIPADPIGSAGPDRVISVVNIGIEARSKTGTLLWRDSLRDFFSTAPGYLGTLTFDPKILYDHIEGRFVVIALERHLLATGDPSDESRIHVAVSTTSSPATATPADWNYLSFDSKIDIGGNLHWADYPGFEVDEEAVYITANMIPFVAGTGGVRLWIIDKGVAGGFYGGGAASTSISDPIPGGFNMTMMPAQVKDPAGVGPGIGTYLIGYNSLTVGGVGGNEALQVVRIDNPLGAPAFVPEFVFVGDIEDVGGVFGFPPLPDAPQSGTAVLIEVNDTRSLDAVWHDGDIWVTTTINPNSGPDAGETTAHWTRLDASAVINSSSAAGLITLGDQGDIGGEDIAANTTTSFPSVAVNSAGEAKFGFSASAATIFCGAYVTGREPADPLGTVQPSQLVRGGTDFYVRTLGTGRNRWGDYSGISVDPADDSVFWIYNKYADTRGTPTNPPPEDGKWGTAWASCSFTPPPTEPPPPFLSEWGNGGSGQGQFNIPQFAAVDDCGNVYVTDGVNDRVQKFDAAGNFLLEWGSSGTGSGEFDLPGGIAVDEQRLVYVGDGANNRVQVFDEDGTYVTEWGGFGTGNSQFDLVTGVAVGPLGNVYVCDFNNDRIQVFDSSGGFLDTWGTTGTGNGQFDQPNGIAVSTGGDVYVVDELNNRVQKFTSAGTFVDKWGTPGSGNGEFSTPYDVALDGSGDVYVSDRVNNRVQKFDASGTFLTTWGTNGAAPGEMSDPRGIAVSRSDQIYVVDSGNNRIQRFGIADGPVLPFVVEWGSSGSGPGELRFPGGLEVNDLGVVHVVDRANNRVQQFNAFGGYIGEWGSAGTNPGEFNNPQDVAIDTDSEIFVTDFGNHRVQKFDADGTFILEWGTNGTGSGEFDSPTGIAVDGTGNVFVGDLFNERIQKFDNTGTFLFAWGSAGFADGQFQQITGVATDALGNVYVTDATLNRVQKFDNNGTFLGKWGDSGWGRSLFDNAADVAVDAAGNVYVADLLNERVQQFDSDGNYLTQWGCLNGDPGQFERPRGIATDVDGDVYVTGDINDRVQRFGLGTVAIDGPGRNSGTLMLHALAPNPVRDQTTIRFDLPASSVVSLLIYDVRGRLVRAGLDQAQMSAGQHQFIWDGRSNAGVQLSPGIYFVTLTTPQGSESRKAILVR